LYKKRHLASSLVLLLALFCILPVGCGGGGEGKISEVTLAGASLQDSFALYYPVLANDAPRVPAYTVSQDLVGVAGVDAANLTAAEKRILGAQGFVAVAGTSDSIYSAYQDTAGAKFVTVDALLNTFHEICANTLRDVETGFLSGDLRGLVASLYATVERMYSGGEGTVREAALMDLAYLAVAAGLLGVEIKIPPDIAGMVEEEQALIAAHAGTAVSPIFAYSEDYGRYAPSGYYEDGGDFQGYYQAMTWLGGMAFYANAGTSPGDIVTGRDMTRRALVLVCALHIAEFDGESAYVVWDRIFQPCSFLASFADDLNAYTYTSLARELYGDSFPLSRLEDDALMDEFISRAVGEQAPLIVSMAGEGEGAGEDSPAFRLFGQTAFPDDYIFHELVAPQVPERYMPRGLDLPAAMGSGRALQILEEFYGEMGYEGYEENMEALRSLLKNVDPVQAHSNAYWSCLDVLRLALKPCGEGYPSFMRAAAWQDRALYDFLGSWTDVRHRDTGCDSVQESVEAQDAGAAGEQGYVEPYPEAFARLAAATDVVRRGLNERGLASAPVRERLDALYELLLSLKVMAEKELGGEPLSADEYAAIANIGQTLQYLVTFSSGGEEETSLQAGAFMPSVNDVYYDANYGEVLQTAVSRPVIYYIIAPVAGKPTLTVGAGYSYYEFVKPADGTLTDTTWREALEAGQLPEIPAWTTSFLQ
jgi:hypothetical protein